MLKKPESLVISRWYAGLITQRNPLLTPMDTQGPSVIARYDALIDGLNTELSNRATVERRPGFSTQCTAGVTDPLGFFSFRNIAGTIRLLVDTATDVRQFDGVSTTLVCTKSVGAGQTRFQSVGNTLYAADGVDIWKWDGTTVSAVGIVAPTTAPTITVQGSPNGAAESSLQINSPVPAGQASKNIGNPGGNWEWDGVSSGWRLVTAGAGETNALRLRFAVPSIPPGHIVTGVAITFSAVMDSGGAGAQHQLAKTGFFNDTTPAFVGTTKSDTQAWPFNSYQAYTYGGVTDLWGRDSADILNEAKAGQIDFAITANDGVRRSFLSGFYLTVYLAPTSTWQPGTAVAKGRTIVDSNGKTQVVTTAGTTGLTVPIWSTTEGNTTGDGTVVWTNYGVLAAGDGAVPPALSPQSGYRYVYVYKNSTSGAISTASPISQNTGPQTAVSFLLSGAGSADSQVNLVQIYRTTDGGSEFYLLAEFSETNPWSYQDTTADALLNDQLLAPLDHANDPPPAGASLITFHVGRLWLAVNHEVYFAGGPDVTNGNPEEAWPPAYIFKFPGKVMALASTSAGLLVFTRTDVYIIRGLDTVSFYSQKFLSNFGVMTQNAIAQDGDVIYLFTSQRQLWSFTDSLDETGFDIGDRLLAMDPANISLALHRSSTDGGLFLKSDANQLYRYNLARRAWSPPASPAGGASCIGSLMTDAGQRLLLGQSGTSFILYRNVSTWEDSGGTVSADNFNRANGAIGANWTFIVGAGGSMDVVSNQVVATTSPGNSVAYNWAANTGSEDYSVELEYRSSPSYGSANAVPAMRVRLRMPDNTSSAWNSGYQLGLVQTSDTTWVWQLVRGVGLVASGAATAPSAGNVLKLSVTGSTLTAYWQGALLTTYVDSANTYPTGQKAGIQMAATGFTADNFLVAPGVAPYSAYATVGNIVVAPVGFLSTLEALLIERAANSGEADATVEVLLNEVSGSFTALPNPVNDPPLLPASSTVISKRHYLNAAQTPLPQMLRHLQVKVTFPTVNKHSELFTLGLMPPKG